MTIEQILEAIENMKVLELNELVKAAEEKFGVSASAPVMVAGAAGGAAAGAHCVHRLCGRENPGQHRQTEINAGRLGGCSHRRGRAVR